MVEVGGTILGSTFASLALRLHSTTLICSARRFFRSVAEFGSDTIWIDKL